MEVPCTKYTGNNEMFRAVSLKLAQDLELQY